MLSRATAAVLAIQETPNAEAARILVKVLRMDLIPKDGFRVASIESLCDSFMTISDEFLQRQRADSNASF